MDHLQQSIRVGILDLPDMADKAVQGLVDSGIPRDSISVICSEKAYRDHFPDLSTSEPAGAETPDRTIAGGILGGLLGGFTALVVATTGGLGLVAAGGLLVIMGAGAGSFVGAMTSRGVEPEAADYYDQALEDGKIAVVVECPQELEPEVKRVFKEAGARTVELSSR